MVIRDGDLVLRLWSAADRAAVNDLVTSSRCEFDGWLPRLVSDLTDFKAFIARVVRCAGDGHGWWYAVEADGIVVGQCSTHTTQDGAAEIGYWIRSDRANEGIMTRAVRALCTAAADHGFTTLLIHCDEGNARSVAVARKLSFTHLRTVDLDPRLPRTSAQTGREMTWTLPSQS